MFHVSTSSRWTVDADLVRLVVIAVVCFALYFFSTQLQVVFAKLLKKVAEKVGVYSTGKEFTYQRYVYQHSSSPISKLYVWVNNQLVALGLKRLGVTVVGYLLFWAFIAFFIALFIDLIAKMGILFFPIIYVVTFVCILVMTRVMVSERMEMREADVMNAVDLIVPEIKNGVKNAIVTYKDNFAPSIRDDFQAFITNVQDRGYSFEDAMYILSDSLGLVFGDFAQKAIYYEAVGEKEMVDIFSDITETNRLRRQLRDENNAAFTSLKVSFVVSALMTFGYFIFLMFTDDFSRTFFLTTTAGKFLLIVMVIVVFAVLAYISTIKSKSI